MHVLVQKLVRNSKRDSKKGDKAQDKWTGPYIIDKDMCNGSYKLKTEAGKQLKQAVNIMRLKKYNAPSRYTHYFSCTYSVYNVISLNILA